MSDDRRAPAEGYVFPEKHVYRNDVWRVFADMWGEQLGERHTLILPSSEGLEIPVALRWGAGEGMMFGVDQSPAVIATAKWRGVYPDVKGLGSSVGRAAERIVSEHGVRLGAVNLDLCNKFSKPLVDELRQFGASGVLDDTAVVAITMLKGREHPETVAALQLMAERLGLEWNNEGGRPFFACLFMTELAAKDRAWAPVAWGEYRSGSKNMVWMVAATATHDAMVQEAVARGWREFVPNPLLDERGRRALRDAHEYWRYQDHYKARFRHGPLFHWDVVGENHALNRDHNIDADTPPGHRFGWRRGNINGQADLVGALRDRFTTADRAQDYFGDPTGGMWEFSLRRFEERLESGVEELKQRVGGVRLPWSGEWRNAPHLPAPEVESGYSEYRGCYVNATGSKADAPTLAEVTQPFNTWKINQRQGGLAVKQTLRGAA